MCGWWEENQTTTAVPRIHCSRNDNSLTGATQCPPSNGHIQQMHIKYTNKQMITKNKEMITHPLELLNAFPSNGHIQLMHIKYTNKEMITNK